MKTDFDTIHTMVKRANKAGVLIEVLETYTQQLQAGETVYDAARHALYEWDC